MLLEETYIFVSREKNSKLINTLNFFDSPKVIHTNGN